MNLGFAVAAAIGLAGFFIHVVLGGTRLVRPFLAIQMHPMVKWLFYLCFHIVSLMIAAMAAVFVWAAVDFHGHAAALLMGGLAIGSALVALYVSIRGKISPFRMIPLWLFLGMALATFWGMYGSFWDLIARPL